MKRLTATAPLRVDLAGGTLDIWPLYLLHDRATTVNVALSLRARVTYEAGGTHWELRSDDREARRRVAPQRVVGAASKALDGDPFALVLQVLRHVGWQAQGRIHTHVDGPPGGGLAGSSALIVALLGLVHRGAGKRFYRRDAPLLARDLEARVLRLPTGVQDYYPALHGGALQLHYEAGQTSYERLPVDYERFEGLAVLAYSGKPHSSAPSNWGLFRRRLEGDPVAESSFEAIAAAARKAALALRRGDWRRLGEAMNSDWAARKLLDPRLAPADLRRLEKVGLAAGARAAKCCGAASGGTMLFLLRRSQDRRHVERELAQAGAQILPFTVARRGLQVRAGDAS